MNDLDLDAIEARYAKAHFVDMESFMQLAFQIGLDITALIAEVRRLRAMLDLAADEYDDFVRDHFNKGPGTTKLLSHWSEEVANK